MCFFDLAHIHFISHPPGVNELKFKSLRTVPRILSRWCYIEIHGKSAKYRYVDEIPKNYGLRDPELFCCQ